MDIFVDLSMRHWAKFIHPRRVLGDHYWCLKFGWFSVVVLIICQF